LTKFNKYYINEVIIKKILLIISISSLIFAQDVPNSVLSNLDRYLSKRTAENIISEKTLGENESMKSFKGQRALINAGKLYKSVAPSVVLVINSTEGIMGSGSFIDTEGYIITNYHVVEGADPEIGLTVVPYDKNISNTSEIEENDIFSVEVIGTLKNKDLALLKIQGYKALGKEINPIKLGSHLSVDVADDVFAIGHPSSFLWYYTSGTINKVGQYSWSYSEDFSVSAKTIFTQTPINPGNSGGPLLNEKGEMIGINSSGHPNMQNVNLAVRIDEVKNFARKAKRGETSKDTGFVASNWSKRVNDNRKFLDGIWDDLDWEIFNDKKSGNKRWYVEYENSNGRKYRVLGLDLDGDDLVDAFRFDTNSDGKTDLEMYDKDKDGSYSYWYIDNDYDGKTDKEGYIDDLF